MTNNQFVYIVLKHRFEGKTVEIQGIFTTEAAALNACRTDEDVYLPIELNKEYPQECEETQDIFCPKQGLVLRTGSSEWVPYDFSNFTQLN